MNNEKKHPKEEKTNCNECGEEIHVDEAEHHGGMCRDCYNSARHSMLDEEKLKNRAEEVKTLYPGLFRSLRNR